MDVVDYASSSIGSVSMSVAYEYDNAGRLLSVKKDSDPAAAYAYDLSGRRTSLALPNGVVTAYTYDSEDRLLALTMAKDSNVLAGFAYTLDPAGNRAGITYADGSKSEYFFDDAYRLTRDKRLDATDQILYDESYTYNSVGNRLTKARTGWNPVDVAYAYNARNQLVFSSDGKTYGYDANGNTVSVTSAAGAEAMEYDVLNRLTRYEGPEGVEETAYRGAAWHRWSVSAQAAGAVDPLVMAFLYDWGRCRR
jgi:YD repeat-containing protein